MMLLLERRLRRCVMMSCDFPFVFLLPREGGLDGIISISLLWVPRYRRGRWSRGDLSSYA